MRLPLCPQRNTLQNATQKLLKRTVTRQLPHIFQYNRYLSRTLSDQSWILQFFTFANKKQHKTQPSVIFSPKKKPRKIIINLSAEDTTQCYVLQKSKMQPWPWCNRIFRELIQLLNNSLLKIRIAIFFKFNLLTNTMN